MHESSAPAQFLVDNIDLLPPGKALDIAMGRGRNTLYLAARGWHVTGIDISPENVKMALDVAGQLGVNVDAVVADLEDNYEIPEAAFDLIICFNYLQRSLIPQIISGLKTGGTVVYETFIIDQKQFGHPQNPDYLLEHNELLEMFRELRCLRYHEGIMEGRKAVAGIIAQKT